MAPAHILSVSTHNTAVVSSEAKQLLWPPYTSIKAIYLFLLLFSLICYFISTLLYTVQVWINWTELNWADELICQKIH